MEEHMARTVPRLPEILRPARKRQPAEEVRPARERQPAEEARPRSARTWWPVEKLRPRSAARRRPAADTRGRPAEEGRPRHVWPLPVRLLAILVAFACMVAFAVALARITLQPSPASVPLTHSNLHPGRSLRAYLEQASLRDALRQLGGNVLLGVPFGVLVPVLAPRARGVLQVLALTALVMLMVELVQGALVTGRAFDIDDVILNTAGALLGWLLLGRRLGRGVHRRVREPAAD
ncbi:VanZ family protein [Streptomyces hygroscopicus]|uniref:VanZ family protein n=1 Tax=Streptomyces olivaceoviridis TaxID=1921 RepID=UPI00024BDAA4|nr:integral membrane protein [Streptomyces hygroscopicus subsp. jinggangensis 5008]AGF67490.1 integral membrane protein [Streptomyces hygroscopicus subsp. jinggangensis TL01]